MENVPDSALIVTGVFAVTLLVVILNVAVIASAATVTLAGTEAADSELDRLILAPAAPASPLMVTVAVDVAPPLTLDGDSDIDFGSTGSIVSVTVLLFPPYVTLMTDEVAVVTVEVFTGNVTELLPALIVAVAGTMALPLELVMVAVAVPEGTAPSSCTVTVDVAPPRTVLGNRLTAPRVSGWILTSAVFVTPP